jgi:hypothetical protein
MDQWIYTFQRGLVKNPELDKKVWACVMDIYKISETDQFVARECRKNPDASLDEITFRALVLHLNQCDIRDH